MFRKKKDKVPSDKRPTIHSKIPKQKIPKEKVPDDDSPSIVLPPKKQKILKEKHIPQKNELVSYEKIDTLIKKTKVPKKPDPPKKDKSQVKIIEKEKHIRTEKPIEVIPSKSKQRSIDRTNDRTINNVDQKKDISPASDKIRPSKRKDGSTIPNKIQKVKSPRLRKDGIKPASRKKNKRMEDKKSLDKILEKSPSKRKDHIQSSQMKMKNPKKVKEKTPPATKQLLKLLNQKEPTINKPRGKIPKEKVPTEKKPK